MHVKAVKADAPTVCTARSQVGDEGGCCVFFAPLSEGCACFQEPRVFPSGKLNHDLMVHDGCHYGLSGNAVESIKELIISRAGQQIIRAADAGDKITIRLLSGLHINLQSSDAAPAYRSTI